MTEVLHQVTVVDMTAVTEVLEDLLRCVRLASFLTFREAGHEGTRVLLLTEVGGDSG